MFDPCQVSIFLLVTSPVHMHRITRYFKLLFEIFANILCYCLRLLAFFNEYIVECFFIYDLYRYISNSIDGRGAAPVTLVDHSFCSIWLFHVSYQILNVH